MIAAVDEFIIYDDAQYTRSDWRNRNLIKTPQGTHWLTVPVLIKSKHDQSIRDAEIANAMWQKKHWQSFVQYYRKAAHFYHIAEWLEPLYLQECYTNISELNIQLIKAICGYLGIQTKLSNSWDYSLLGGKTERLVDLCKQAEATEYISGPAAKGYINESIFKQAGIKLHWFDYTGYKEYPQLYGNFEHGVTILDLLFNCGKEAPRYMRYAQK